MSVSVRLWKIRQKAYHIFLFCGILYFYKRFWNGFAEQQQSAERKKDDIMRQFLENVWKLLGKNWVSLLIFEILYRIFFNELVTRTARATVNFSLRKQDYSYMTEENFMEFIGHPLTIVLMVLGILMVLLLLLFEICALFGCMEASWKKEKISVPGMICAGVVGSIRFIRRKPAGWALAVGGAVPCLLFQAMYGFITGMKLLQITAAKVFQAFPNFVIPGILAVLLLLLSVLFTYSLPFRVLMEEPERKVFQRVGEVFGGSWKKAVRRLGRELGRYFILQLIFLGILLLLYLVSHMLIVLYVLIVGSPQALVSAVLVYSDGAKSVLGGMAAGLGTSGTLLYFYLLFAGSERGGYRRERRRKKTPSRLRRILAGKAAAIVLTAVLAVGECVYLIYVVQREHPSATASSDYISVSAHRGGARKAPENTLSALEYAISSKSDFAEIDVQETKDGEVVLLHDNNLKRTTGLNANIWTLTYAELQQLDAGVRFNQSFRGEKIPTLEEAIEAARGKIQLNIEVKYNGHNPNLVRKVVRIIEEQEFAENCVLTSMNYKFLEQAKALNPKIRTGYTMNMTYGDLENMDGADFFSVKYTYITERFVEKVHALGKEVYAWTLNYQGDIQRMVNCKVDNIITDDPELVRQVILGGTDRSPGFLELLKYALK